MTTNCQTCRYWDDDSVGQRGLGECRFQPPQANGDDRALFPLVSRSDWCGAWKLRPTEADESADARDLLGDLLAVWPTDEDVVALDTLVDHLRGLDLLRYSGSYRATDLASELDRYGIKNAVRRIGGNILVKRAVERADVEEAVARLRALASPAESTEAQ